MALRWNVGLPGPFSVSGNVAPRVSSQTSDLVGTWIVLMIRIVIWTPIIAVALIVFGIMRFVKWRKEIKAASQVRYVDEDRDRSGDRPASLMRERPYGGRKPKYM